MSKSQKVIQAPMFFFLAHIYLQEQEQQCNFTNLLMFQNIHIYIIKSMGQQQTIKYEVGLSQQKKKKRVGNGKPLELMTKISKRGSTSFQQQHSNFNMTTYNFTKKRNMTTFNKLKQTNKTFSQGKKKKKSPARKKIIIHM